MPINQKIKLEIALKEAIEFHETPQDFVDWVTRAENYLKNLSSLSRYVDDVLKQVKNTKIFRKMSALIVISF